jgi:isopentenyl diphosphate isomerase/L-lactate dehydrogenase-like FMN-dependent dehydrogenase
VRPIDDCYNVFDLREAARSRLPKCVFEFVDRGTEDEVSLAENQAAFRRLKLRTRFMVDLTGRDMSIDLFGKPCRMPMLIGPTGAAGLCWHLGELALARAAANAGVPFTLTMTSLTPIERIARESGGRLWYQVYMWAETHYTYEMIARARDLGVEALIITIDTAAGRNREYNHRNGFTDPFSINRRVVADMVRHPRWLLGTLLRHVMASGMPRHENYPEKYRRITGIRPGPEPMRHEAMTWRDVAALRRFWPRILIVKGVLSPEDARQALECGADGIVVSNHGGRAMDSAIATIDALPAIVAEVGERTTVLFDSGIRRGSDVLKALALGAKAALIGRATLYGVAVAGQEGAEKALELLRGELEKNMAYVGCRHVREIGPDIFAAPAFGLHHRMGGQAVHDEGPRT